MFPAVVAGPGNSNIPHNLTIHTVIYNVWHNSMMKKLCPTLTNGSNYMGSRRPGLSAVRMENLLAEILKRDGNACVYCGFKADKWQTVTHLDGDPEHNEKGNLATICPMCNLIANAALGCKVEGIVELYAKSRYPQNKIISITRKMRARGRGDAEIVRFLGLEEKSPFKMNRTYLERLYGFVTSWKGCFGRVEEALAFGYADA